MGKRAIPMLILMLLQFSLGFAANNNPSHRNISISRAHVSVWFESPLQEGTKYRSENLEEMIRLVGGTFGTILINPAPETPKLILPETLSDSVLLIPGLVAKHNQQNGNKQLKVMVSFTTPNVTSPLDPFPGNTSGKVSIEVAKFVADKANSIHPGTVDTLLLLDEAVLPYKIDENFIYHGIHLYKNLRTLKWTRKLLQNEVGESQYKLGQLISFHGYLHKESLLADNLKHVDLLVPVIYFDEFYMDPLEEQQLLQDLLDQFEKKIRDMNSNVEIVPLISCRPPINTDFEENSKFLECWQLMSNWAVKYNRSVIMYEAFDQYDDQVKNAGWWRLKSEIILREKESGMEKVDENSFLAKVDETFGVNLKSDVPFNSEATIFFDHRVRHVPHNKFYSEIEAQEMLELVLSRFSSIAIYNKFGYDPRDQISKVIPKMVAQLNKDKSKDPSFQPFTIISNIIHDNWWSRSDWDQAWHAAHSANEIFPGTVRIIAFDKLGKDDIELKNLITFMASLEKDNRPSAFTGIRMGGYLDLQDCFSVLKLANFPSASKWISVLILDITGSVSTKFQFQYVDFKLSSLFAEWRKCNETFKSNYPAVEVMLQVTCSKLVNIGSIDQEAKCWEMANARSKENKVQVVFHQAFETPLGNAEFIFGGKNPDPVEGWWKLKHRSQLNITRDSFVERFRNFMWDSELERSYDNDDEVESGLKCENQSHTGLGVFFTIIVIGCTSLLIFTVYWYNRRTRGGSMEMELI